MGLHLDLVISPQALAAEMSLETPDDLTLLDVRWQLGRDDGHEQYLAGHVPGASYVDMGTDLADPRTTHPTPWDYHQRVPIVLYGPGVLLASRTRGFPSVGTEGFPGNLAVNDQLKTLMKEGASIYACRFAMGALYGFREDDLIPGVKAFNPLDVLDSALYAWQEKAFQLNTWTV